MAYRLESIPKMELPWHLISDFAYRRNIAANYHCIYSILVNQHSYIDPNQLPNFPVKLNWEQIITKAVSGVSYLGEIHRAESNP